MQGWWDRLIRVLSGQRQETRKPVEMNRIERYINWLEDMHGIDEWKVYKETLLFAGFALVVAYLMWFELAGRPSGFVFSFFKFLVVSPIAYLILVLVAVWCAGFGLLGYLVRKRTRALLAEPELGSWFESGSLAEDPIFAYTPWPWRCWLPSRFWDMNRIVNYLDWYLSKPRYNFRWRWVLVPLLFFLFCLLFAGWLFTSDEAYSSIVVFGGFLLPDVFMGAAIASVVLYSLFRSAFYYERCIWHAELLKYLRAYNAEHAAEQSPSTGAVPASE